MSFWSPPPASGQSFIATAILSPDQLREYLTRINLPACDLSTRSLELLNALLLAHVHTIFFENIDVVQRKPISIDLDSLLTKIVRGGRGGYCFEQGTLLTAALRALGYVVVPVLARGRWARDPHTPSALAHVLLCVSNVADGAASPAERFFVDVMFSGIGSFAALRYDALDEVQTNSFGQFRIIETIPPAHHVTARILQMRRRVDVNVVTLPDASAATDDWLDLISFRDEPALQIDMDMGNFFSYACATARWVTCIYATRVYPDRRVTVFNGEFTVRSDAGTVRTKIATHAELVEILAREFGIVLPAGTVLPVPPLSGLPPWPDVPTASA